jgi:hypothetical protein
VVETDTAAEDGGPQAVDTRRPTSDMHDVSFDDVVGKKPVALVFATPQLCQSRVCGPVVDIALQLRQKYGDRMEFIHQRSTSATTPTRACASRCGASTCRRSPGCSPSRGTGGSPRGSRARSGCARSSARFARRFSKSAPREQMRRYG